MGGFEHFTRRLDVSTRWTAFIGFVALLLIAVAIMVDVLMRWLFNAPIEGLDDVSLLMFAVVVISCFPAGLVQGHNVTIRFLGVALGRAAGHWLEAFGALVTLAFFSFVAWEFVVLTARAYEVNDTSMTVQLPTWPWWALGTALMVFCVPVQAAVLAGHLRRAVRGRGPGGTVALEMGAHEAGARAAEEAAARREG